ncbi:MAG: efflux RND transporter permease subunit [Deltaproteobacteria bacterium]|nr:efflux RND transporter permease subunit [Deltaproteobacteria bacterium]
MLAAFVVVWGVIVAPFDWNIKGLVRDPVPVDAIPDIGENQQIVFTNWEGRSPRDVNEQITYPLSVTLLGISGVKSIRSYSMFGFSTIYLIFEDGVDFYWARTRVLENLSSLPPSSLPAGVRPSLGPDATTLGQVFWYTLETQDSEGNPTGGWDLHELRTIQDWYVRYALLGVDGVSEVASIGGFVREYQVDVNPDLMRAFNVKLEEVVSAVQRSNVDVGARTIEVNRVEYVIRGLGFIKSLEDLKRVLVKTNQGIPVFLDSIANVTYGPASRRGVLDKGGREAVGGVVVARFGENPLAVIQAVKRKIQEVSIGLPKKTLPDGTVSQVRIVPFYDRTKLINETLETLRTALNGEVLMVIVVVLVLLAHLWSSVLISSVLPLAVLMCFIAMKIFRVDANIVALSGIAIAIGTIVDMGVIVCENIVRHLQQATRDEDRVKVLFQACREVGGAVVTAVSTTIVGFLPVFAMEGPEGKLFQPLAFTKTFALFASVIVALTLIPPLARVFFAREHKPRNYGWIWYESLIYVGAVVAFLLNWQAGVIIALVGVYRLILRRVSERWERRLRSWATFAAAGFVLFLLAKHWLPLGPAEGLIRNIVFVGVLMGGILVLFLLFQRRYERILTWCLDHKRAFLSIPLMATFLGALVWLGFDPMLGWLPNSWISSAPVSYVARKFPGLGKEFMPFLDEGSYLFMPTTMPHASIEEALDIIQKQDRAIQAIPEVEEVVGKLGRVDSALDPAPLSMIETVINYKSEYLLDQKDKPILYKYDSEGTDWFRDEKGTPLLAPDGKRYRVRGRYVRDESNRLIPDSGGRPFRLWRLPLDPAVNPEREAWSGIRKPEDIWDRIVEAAYIPGATSAPILQPISARIVMLQSGIRASMGIRVSGSDLESIQQAALAIERNLRKVSSIKPDTVIADRIIGKPYVEIDIQREIIAQYSIDIKRVQDTIEAAIGGKPISTTVEGRERYDIRVRYLRELRDSIETLGDILVPAPDGVQIPLRQLARINYVQGPQVIKSEDTFLTGYVLFDKVPEYAEVEAVEQASRYLRQAIEDGELELPEGISFSFTGNYQNQVRSEKKLRLILPLALFIVFLILYLHFNSAVTSLLVFSGIVVAWAGGFIMIWLYGQPWFLNFHVFGTHMGDLFQVHPMNLSVAVWVGFLALFGIASDDGVVMATYLNTTFSERSTGSREEIRRATVTASLRRIRPCLITTATTVMALLPVLSSTGKGADIMVPMAIPSFGGMLLEVITMLVVPVLYCAVKERKLERDQVPARLVVQQKTPSPFEGMSG